MEKNEEIEALKEEIAQLEADYRVLEDGENEDEYDDFIDDVTGVVKIGSLSFSASRILKELDPIAYNCGIAEYNDEKMTELRDEIDEKKAELKELEGEK
jgi:hypothetical protein